MKQILPFLFIVFFATQALGQSRIILPFSQELRHQDQYLPEKVIDNSFLQQTKSRLAGSEVQLNDNKTFSIGSITATKIGEASNAYTFVAPDNHQVSVLPSIGSNGGTVGFIYRQNIDDCGGENGLYRLSISGDGGSTWNLGDATSNASTGCFGLGPLNPAFSFASRYPNMHLFSPDGSAVNAAYVGPVLNTTNQGWNGHVLGVLSDINGSSNVDQEQYLYQVGGQYLPYSLVERVPGEFWYVARESIDGDVGTITDAIVVNKGLWNASTNSIDWGVSTTLTPDFFRGFDGSARFTTPNIAFSPDGTVGYIGFLGDLVGGEDTVYSPVFIESADGGSSWEDPYEFNMGAFPGLQDSLEFAVLVDTVANDTFPAGNGKATTGFSTDLTVDAQGNPHMLAIIGNSNASAEFDLASGGSGDESSGYAISSGIIMFAYDFTKDQTGDWNMLYLGGQNTFRGQFGEDTGDDASTVTADPWMQVSRSSDGNVIFFSWTETDISITNSTENNFPNLVGRAFDISSQKTTSYRNWTFDDPTWAGGVIMPKVSPVALTNGDSYSVPTVFMNLDGGSALDPVSFWYASDITYPGSDFTEDAIFFYNCAQNPFNNTLDISEASCGSSNGSITVNGAGGLGSLSFAWSESAGGQTTATVSGLAAGVYSVVVSDSVGCSETLSITMNNDEAPSLSIDPASLSNISCAGEVDGSATVLVTGGTTPFTYEWSNGESAATAVSLPRGVTNLIVTDGNNCKNFISVGISEPDTLSLTLTPNDVSCNGFADGNINASSFGGTGLKAFLWNTGDVMSQIDSLGGGVFIVTVTDERGCTVSDSATINEPDPLTVLLTSTPNVSESEPFSGTATAITSGGNGGTLQNTFEWSNGGTRNFIFSLCGGTYWVDITDPNGCTVSDTVEVGGPQCTTVSIEGELAAGISNMALYPNPSSQQFRLAFDLESVETIEIRLLQLDGKLIQQKLYDRTQKVDTLIDISELAGGLYMLQVITSKGTATRKLLIQ